MRFAQSKIDVGPLDSLAQVLFSSDNLDSASVTLIPISRATKIAFANSVMLPEATSVFNSVCFSFCNCDCKFPNACLIVDEISLHDDWSTNFGALDTPHCSIALSTWVLSENFSLMISISISQLVWTHLQGVCHFVSLVDGLEAVQSKLVSCVTPVRSQYGPWDGGKHFLKMNNLI